MKRSIWDVVRLMLSTKMMIIEHCKKKKHFPSCPLPLSHPFVVPKQKHVFFQVEFVKLQRPCLSSLSFCFCFFLLFAVSDKSRSFGVESSEEDLEGFWDLKWWIRLRLNMFWFSLIVRFMEFSNPFSYEFPRQNGKGEIKEEVLSIFSIGNLVIHS